MKFNKKVNTTNLSSSILMYSFLNCYQCIMYIYTHIQCARIKKKNRGTRVIFFSWGRVGSVRGLFWGILLCEFNQIKFSRTLDPRICIHLQTTSKVCNCASSTCNNYCAKMFIYMYLHEGVILLFKGLTVTKLFTFCL